MWMWTCFIRAFDHFGDWSIHDSFYGVTGGYHRRNQKKIRRMRRQGCRV